MAVRAQPEEISFGIGRSARCRRRRDIDAGRKAAATEESRSNPAADFKPFGTGRIGEQGTQPNAQGYGAAGEQEDPAYAQGYGVVGDALPGSG